MTQQLNDRLREREIRPILLRGIHRAAAAVGETFGPTGRADEMTALSALLGATPSGASLAGVQTGDSVEDVAVRLVRQAARTTGEVTGDGRTATVLYAEAIFDEGIKGIAADVDPHEVQMGIEKAVAVVVEQYRSLARPVRVGDPQLREVATLAANGDGEIGRVVTKAFERVGVDGGVAVIEGKEPGVHLDITHGLRFDVGFLSPRFATGSDRRRAVLQSAHVLVTEEVVSTVQSIKPILKALEGTGHSLLIVAGDVTEDALAGLVELHERGLVDICAVRAPGTDFLRREWINDLATVTGADAILSESGRTLDSIGVFDLGQANRVVITSLETQLFGAHGSPSHLEARIAFLRSRLVDTMGAAARQDRVAQLARLAGLAVIEIGGPRGEEGSERRAGAEDAVLACRAALEEGILPGGGTALMAARRAVNRLAVCLPKWEAFGAQAVYHALAAPLAMIAKSAGEVPELVVEQVESAPDPSFGFDAEAKEYGDLCERHVVIPTKVERLALEHAAAIAGLLVAAKPSVVSAVASR